ncbi:MAG: hypothetical protein IJS05_07840 [Paludibacteraceae bacterium]|nr:hypothetical protein [Paludibacteraceae bacterium]
MNYNEIKSLIKKKGLDVKFILNEVGMSYDGFRLSIEKQTIESRKLLILCNLLGISPNDFFDFVPSDVTIVNNQTGGIGNCQTNINSSIEALEHQLEVKDIQIKELLEIIKSK